MRKFITLIEKAQDPVFKQALEDWTDFYEKDDAYTGKANAQEREIIELAARHPCTFHGVLYRGQAVEDDVIPRLLKGETVTVPPTKRLIASWSKDEGGAYSFAEDAYLSNFSTLLIRMDSSRLKLIVDTEEWVDHSGEREVIAHAQPLVLTIHDIIGAWLYDAEEGDCVQVWPK